MREGPRDVSRDVTHGVSRGDTRAPSSASSAHGAEPVSELVMERVASQELPASARDALRLLLAESYGEELSQYLTDIGDGVHLLGWYGDSLVSHAMWVTRMLHVEGARPLRAAYVELVATLPSLQRRGLATRMMQRVVHDIRHEIPRYDIAALSPALAPFYAELGWESWRGPLSVRTAGATTPTPEEEIMVLRLAGTPPSLDVGQPLSVDWRPGEVW